MRTHYWTCSKFADWVRGKPKLSMGTSEEWNAWEDDAKRYNPVRYWLAEEGLHYLQNFVFYIPDKLYAAKYYINNRWITRTHALTAHTKDIPRGEWRDIGYRFLPCLFNELVDFVEVELAWWHLAWAQPEERKKYKAPWWRFGWWNIRVWRCPQAGLDNLEWQRNLRWNEEEVSDPEKVGKPTPQAISAQEVLDLYIWWTQVYRNRPDPHDAGGWSEYCNRMREEQGDGMRWIGIESKNPETKALGEQALIKSREIEEAYEREDEEMMIRLIKVRHALWT